MVTEPLPAQVKKAAVAPDESDLAADGEAFMSAFNSLGGG